MQFPSGGMGGRLRPPQPCSDEPLSRRTPRVISSRTPGVAPMPAPKLKRSRKTEATEPAESRRMPTREAIKTFAREAGGKVGKREVARAFKLGPEHRVALRGILKSLAHDGALTPAGHKRFTVPGR